MECVAWVPGWYELDPPLLEVGLEDEFWFWKTVPDRLRGPQRLVLFNGVWSPKDPITPVWSARGKIHSITHPLWGPVRRVDARGFEYTITLADGGQWLVEAEEDPGLLERRRVEGGPWEDAPLPYPYLEDKDWRFVLEMELLSALVEPAASDYQAG